jgi:phosphoribosylanthranilate isomerase
MIRVKICGVTDPAAFDTIVACGADWVGFVFFPASPRALSPREAAALSARYDGGPQRVGLFVEPSDDDVAAALDALPLNALQLYTTPARAAELRARFGVPVWRAVGVLARADLPAAADGTDGFVIEAKPPSGATRPGGNAASIDWRVTAGWSSPAPWVLAGGLTPSNVAEAVRQSGAPAVDVSSGVERSPGVKDTALIRAFVAAARRPSAAGSEELPE